MKVNVHRAPGPAGVFVEEAGQSPRIWRSPGWPANDNLPRATFLTVPSSPEPVDIEWYYDALGAGYVERFGVTL